MRKALFMLPIAAALVTACGGGVSTPDQGANTTKPASVNGTIQIYTRGAATIDLLRNEVASKSASNPALASATLNANGTFTLGLPSLAAVTPELSVPGSANTALFTDPTCSGALSNSVPEAQAYSFSTLNASGIIYDNGSSSVDTNAGRITEDGSVWIYTTKATTISGSLSCPAVNNGLTSVTTINANAPLAVGWNLVDLRAVGTLSGDLKSFTLNMTISTVNDHATLWSASTIKPLVADPLAAVVSQQIRKFKSGPLHF
jgi:hypothetical protein